MSGAAEANDVIDRMAGLTEAEREAFLNVKLDDEPQGVEGVDPDQVAADTDPEDPEDQNAEAAKEAAAEAEAEKVRLAEEAEAKRLQAEAREKAGKPPVEDPPVQQQEVQPVIVPPAFDKAAHEAKIADVEKRQLELDEKFAEGELTTVDYHKQRNALADERADLRDAAKEAERAVKEQDARSEAEWRAAVTAFFKANPSLNTESPVVMGAFDQAFKVVDKDPANRGKSDTELLNLALARYRKDMGLTAPTPQQTAEEKARAEAKANKEKAEREGRVQPLRTLRDVPQADIDEAGTNEFADLDRLMNGKDAIAYEQALEALEKRDPAAFDRYMARA